MEKPTALSQTPAGPSGKGVEQPSKCKQSPATTATTGPGTTATTGPGTTVNGSVTKTINNTKSNQKTPATATIFNAKWPAIPVL